MGIPDAAGRQDSRPHRAGPFRRVCTDWRAGASRASCRTVAVPQRPAFGVRAKATGVAIIGNFALNNWLTYRDHRLVGWEFAWGLLSFALICGFGAIANVGIA